MASTATSAATPNVGVDGSRADPRARRSAARRARPDRELGAGERPSPQPAPSAAIRPIDGLGVARYESQTTTAPAKMAAVSESSMPSWTQRLGYTAAIAAAQSPRRSPPTSRPASPQTAIVAVPRTADHTRCGPGSSTGRRCEGEPERVGRGMRRGRRVPEPDRLDEPVALREQVRTLRVVHGVAADRHRGKSQPRDVDEPDRETDQQEDGQPEPEAGPGVFDAFGGPVTACRSA